MGARRFSAGSFFAGAVFLVRRLRFFRSFAGERRHVPGELTGCASGLLQAETGEAGTSLFVFQKEEAADGGRAGLRPFGENVAAKEQNGKNVASASEMFRELRMLAEVLPGGSP